MAICSSIGTQKTSNEMPLGFRAEGDSDEEPRELVALALRKIAARTGLDLGDITFHVTFRSHRRLLPVVGTRRPPGWPISWR